MGNDNDTASKKDPAGLVQANESEERQLSWMLRLTLSEVIERLETLPRMVASEKISQETADKFSEELKEIAIDEIVPSLTDDEEKYASSYLVRIFGSDFQNSDWQGIFESLARKKDGASEYGDDRHYAEGAIEQLSKLLPLEGVKELDRCLGDNWSEVLQELKELEKKFQESSDVDKKKSANSLWSFIGAHPQMYAYAKKDILHPAEEVADQQLLNGVYPKLPR